MPYATSPRRRGLESSIDDSVVDLSIWGATLCWRGGGAPFVLRALNMNYWPIAPPGDVALFALRRGKRQSTAYQVIVVVYLQDQ